MVFNNKKAMSLYFSNHHIFSTHSAVYSLPSKNILKIIYSFSSLKHPFTPRRNRQMWLSNLIIPFSIPASTPYRRLTPTPAPYHRLNSTPSQSSRHRTMHNIRWRIIWRMRGRRIRAARGRLSAFGAVSGQSNDGFRWWGKVDVSRGDTGDIGTCWWEVLLVVLNGMNWGNR